ncbi:MAG: Mitomycin biosynthesis 6-O-methyltransferase [Chlamydiae bacterium]|nr:Mitomycin biosynthesis 6-O-methyltransferase [Chlamydiota bacterium]
MKTTLRPSWQTYKISPDGTHHLLKGDPAYKRRFNHVMKFHSPGLAPVSDENGAYHIDPTATPPYTERYTRTFGFYSHRSAVNHDGKWFHILPDGTLLNSTSYGWCGNFQEEICAVKDRQGQFFHIDISGERLYTESYSYVGDFHDGAAVVQNSYGHHTHIDLRGKRIHSHEFIDLDVFHKGFARAKDTLGWFHITQSGSPLYPERYALVEPFYNGIARVETKWGELLLIDEYGEAVQTLRSAIRDPFHEVSGDLTSYWRLFTLKTAQDLKIFDALPATLEVISEEIGLAPTMTEKIILALMELEYIVQVNSEWRLTARGQFLHSSHPYSLEQAQQLWMMEHFDCWRDLSNSLKNGQSSFEEQYNMNWFEFLDRNPEKRELYHHALSKYAMRDYSSLGKKIDFTSHTSIADIGGSTGTLLEMLLEEFPHLHGHLLDLPSVLDQIELPSINRKRITLHPLDFFKKWPLLKVDAVILCRIIHDWPDEKALHILRKVRPLLKDSNSRLYVVENLLCKESGDGALLNLNMFVMTGSQERTFDEFMELFKKAGFVFESKTPLNEVSSILAFKPLK